MQSNQPKRYPTQWSHLSNPTSCWPKSNRFIQIISTFVGQTVRQHDGLLFLLNVIMLALWPQLHLSYRVAELVCPLQSSLTCLWYVAASRSTLLLCRCPSVHVLRGSLNTPRLPSPDVIVFGEWQDTGLMPRRQFLCHLGGRRDDYADHACRPGILASSIVRGHRDFFRASQSSTTRPLVRNDGMHGHGEWKAYVLAREWQEVIGRRELEFPAIISSQGRATRTRSRLADRPGPTTPVAPI